MDWLIWVGVAAVVLIVVMVVAKRSGGTKADSATAKAPSSDRLRPVVTEFRVTDRSALVHFDVPLGDETDPVLSDLLGREAVEVVREKRHTLPIDEVVEVVALGRKGGGWEVAARISLTTPGALPPPLMPETFAHARRSDVDLFDRFANLPSSAPGLADHAKGEDLAAIGSELHFPATIGAGLRSQGIDPVAATAGDIVLGVMRVVGYQVTESGAGSFSAVRGGRRAFVRVVDHNRGDHPELEEQEIRRFVVDFGSSGADNGLLISEKYGPFEIYERERRDKRVRFVTRERLQAFVDALSVA